MVSTLNSASAKSTQFSLSIPILQLYLKSLKFQNLDFPTITKRPRYWSICEEAWAPTRPLISIFSHSFLCTKEYGSLISINFLPQSLLVGIKTVTQLIHQSPIFNTPLDSLERTLKLSK